MNILIGSKGVMNPLGVKILEIKIGALAAPLPNSCVRYCR